MRNTSARRSNVRRAQRLGRAGEGMAADHQKGPLYDPDGQKCPGCGVKIRLTAKGRLWQHSPGGEMVNVKKKRFVCPAEDTPERLPSDQPTLDDEVEVDLAIVTEAMAPPPPPSRVVKRKFSPPAKPAKPRYGKSVRHYAPHDEVTSSPAPEPAPEPEPVPEPASTLRAVPMTPTIEKEPVQHESPVATVLTDPRIDPDRLMLSGVDTETKGPRFTVSEMAKLFFARSNHWVRWLESTPEVEENPDKPGKMIAIEGTKGVPFWFTDPQTGEKRKVGQRRNEKSARVYTLGDIEEVAHALAQNGHISGTQLRQTLLLVQVSAEMRGFL